MINVANINKAYSEVYCFLNTLGIEYISKIPDNIYSAIEKSRDVTYNPSYDINQEVTGNTFSKEALALIAALNLQYFCENEEEKRRLKEIYLKNTQEEMEKYSTDNVFRKKQETLEIENKKTIPNETQLIVYKKDKWYNKLFNKILRLFKK